MRNDMPGVNKLQLFILDCGKSKSKREEESVQQVIGGDTTIDKVGGHTQNKL